MCSPGRVLHRPAPSSVPRLPRIDDLREYKQKHGHVNVKIHEDSSLYQFCAGARHSLKHVKMDGTRKLTEERIARLDALGFDWTKSVEASVDAAAPAHEK